MQRLKVSALIVFGLSILFVFFFQFCKHAPDLGPANPFGEDPYDAVGSYGIQLALLAASLTLVCVFRPYPQENAAPGQILLALRGGTVALLSVAVTLAADAIGLVRATIVSGAFLAAWPLAGLLGGMALLTVLAGWAFARSARRAEVPSAAPPPWARAVILSVLAALILALYPLAWRDSGVPGAIVTALAGMVLLFVPVWAIATAIFPAVEFSYEDFFDDLAAIYQGLRKRLRFAAGLFAWLEKIAASPPARKFFGWLNPRRYRWNLVLLAAVVVGLLLVLAKAVVEGMPGNLGRLLLVVSIYIGLEGAGVLLGYVLLGKVLGIYRKFDL